MRTTLLIALTLLFTTYIYGQERTKTLDLTQGSITITETGYTQNTTQGTKQETKFTGSYVITQSNSSSNTTNTIDVKSGTHTITLNGIWATNSKADHSPLSLFEGVEATLFLTGENRLGSWIDDNTCLHVPSDATLTIKGDGLLKTNSQKGAAIGGNSGEHCGKIIIESGTIEISVNSSGAGIGAGAGSSTPNTGEIIINGGNIHVGTGYNTTTGAFIGGSEGCDGGTITICGGNIYAPSYAGGAAIGGGKGGGAGDITITGGLVKARGDSGGSAIGSGAGYTDSGSGGTIKISGGVVDASTYDDANTAPIGGTNTAVEITDKAVVFAYNTKKDDNTGISSTTGESQWKGIVFKGKTGKVYGNDVTLSENVVIPDGFTLTVDEGKKLTVAEDAIVVNKGTIVCSNGTLENSGTIVNKGTFTGTMTSGSNSVVTALALSADMFVPNPIPDYVYTGKTIKPGVTLKGGLGNEDVYSVSYSDNTNIGKGKIKVTANEGTWLTGNPLELSFTITKAPLTVAPKEGQILYKGETIEYETYGEIKDKAVAFSGALSISNKVIDKGTLELTTESAAIYELKFLTGVKATHFDIKPEDADVTLTPNGSNGWFTTTEGITFTAPDGFTIAQVNGDASTPTYGESFVFANAEGTNTVSYSLQRNGTTYSKSKEVKIDHTAPAITANDPVIDKLKATFTLTDATSGIASYSYKLDGGTEQTEKVEDAPKNSCQLVIENTAGSHTLVLTITDVAGNEVTYDNLSFNLLADLTVTPEKDQKLYKGESILYEVTGILDGDEPLTGALELEESGTDGIRTIKKGTLTLKEEYKTKYALTVVESVTATYVNTDPSTIDITLDEAGGNDGWYTTEGGIIFAAPASGDFVIALTGSELKADPAYESSFTWSTEGSYTVKYNLRRTTTEIVYEKTKDVKYDHTAPALKDGAPTVSYLEATFTLTDATSGIASYSYTLDDGSTDPANVGHNDNVNGDPEAPSP
ncbi:hypothetical protein [Parabacteroides sp. AF48-14]|uniref:hypothetical protein n=1 Tax=Parabacteroides sp. AF48-14 TaxID=2292052 RepID=UPI0011C495C3|nr:hypothetical protein [Parabacteroides sp. AF48-14]